MAREVNTVLGKIMAEQRGIPESKAEEIVKGMRSANQYQVRDSLLPYLLPSFVCWFVCLSRAEAEIAHLSINSPAPKFWRLGYENEANEEPNTDRISNSQEDVWS